MWIVRQYRDVFRSRMVERMVGPGAVSANALSHEVGVSQNSLSRWLREARSLQGMSETSKGPKRSKQPQQRRSGAEKLRIVMEASALTGSELGALLRREGLHETELQEWRAAAEAALGEPLRSRARPSGRPSLEVKRIRELERELDRKEKALAETAALLVLKKKSRSSGGTRTIPRTGRAGDDTLAHRASRQSRRAAEPLCTAPWAEQEDSRALARWWPGRRADSSTEQPTASAQQAHERGASYRARGRELGPLQESLAQSDSATSGR